LKLLTQVQNTHIFFKKINKGFEFDFYLRKTIICVLKHLLIIHS